MRGRVFVKGFVTALPPYCRPQREAFEWLAAAHARAAATDRRGRTRWRGGETASIGLFNAIAARKSI